MGLEKNDDIPLYYQLENKIRKKISKGKYVAGEKIPSERSLSKKFDVSRMTARKALENLVDEGILEKRERQGTFVSKSSNNTFPSLVGINESIESLGKEPSNKVIKKELIKADLEIRNQLNVMEEEKIILIERINLADGVPVGFEQSYIPYAICPELLEREVTHESIYQILIDNGHKPTRATDKTKAVSSTNRIVELLEINPEEPVLKNTRTTFSKDRPIVFSYNYYRGEEFTLERTVFNFNARKK
jgi:GntR family transcriptional regulator